MNKKDIVRRIPITIINFIFLLFQMTFALILNGSDQVKNLDLCWKPKRVILVIVVSLLLAVLMSFVFSLIGKALKGKAVKADSEFKSKFFKFPIVWGVIVLCHLPMYLAFFPGICAYDAYVQLEQCISGNYIDHHPFLHTLILNLFWNFADDIECDGWNRFVCALPDACFNGCIFFRGYLLKKART